MTARLDIVLLGATGFTGRLVAEYLWKEAPASLTFGVAGRNAEKLADVVHELRKSAQSSGEVRDGARADRDVPILVADSGNEAELRAMVKRARVVCTTVGPYGKYGRTLARVCAEEGVHYTDLTGEVPFMRQSIDDNDANARRTKARIVHACGFDSIPSDLGTYLLFRRAEEMGLTLGPTTLLVRKADGGFSGGTVASLLELTDLAKKDPAVRALLLDPHALEPNAPPTRDRRDRFGVAFDADLDVWTAPFIMAMCNTRVVRRTNALLHHAYGPEFRYREVMSFPKGPRGAALAYGITGALAAFTGAISTKLRGLVEKRLPKPGEGPTAEKRAAGSFKLDIVSVTRTRAREPGPTLTVRIVGEGDPGYAATARMLGEATMSLASDALPERFGVLTPSYAMGDFLAARLGGAGVTFTVSE